MKHIFKVFKLQHYTRTDPSIIIGQLVKLISQTVGKVTITIDSADNIIIEKGDQSGRVPIIVAHYDQVHKVNPYFKLELTDGLLFAYDRRTNIQIGVGGDDKCGIYIVIEMLQRFKNIKAVLFSDEESGFVGSRHIDLKVFDNASVVLQADRKGNSDVCNHTNGVQCTTKAYEDKITPILNRYNYHFAYGVATDVGELKARGMLAPTMNISCGYYLAHTSKEFVKLDELATATELAFDILNVKYQPEYDSVGEVDYAHWGMFDEDQYYPSAYWSTTTTKGTKYQSVFNKYKNDVAKGKYATQNHLLVDDINNRFVRQSDDVFSPTCQSCTAELIKGQNGIYYCSDCDVIEDPNAVCVDCGGQLIYDAAEFDYYCIQCDTYESVKYKTKTKVITVT